MPVIRTNSEKSEKSNEQICTSNHMFKRGIWDKFTKFTFSITPTL